MNTDRELWREREGDYYADSIHVTKGGGIGIKHGGHVIVMPLAKWHLLAVESIRHQSHQTVEAAIDAANLHMTQLRAEIARLQEQRDAESLRTRDAGIPPRR